jgi:chaperonin cofactor prefoldin
MEFLKRNGKRFTVEHLQQLMTIVREKNIISVDHSKYFTQLDAFKDVLEKLDMTDSTVIEEPLRRHIGAVLSSFSPSSVSNELSQELKTLNGYLLTTNQRLYNEIMEFFDVHGNLTNNEYEKLHEFLSKIRKWELDKPMKESQLYYDDGLYTITQFIKNAIHSMSKLYPNILLNNAGFYKKVPKHWGLSQFHVSDVTNIITSYYQKIEKFKEDKVLLRLLMEIDTKLMDITMFIENIPIQTEIIKLIDGEMVKFHSLFDKTTIYRLYSYCFYSTIHEYRVSSFNNNLVRMDLNEYRGSMREIINNNSNMSNQIGTQLVDLQQTNIERDNDFQEVQIETGNLLELKERVCNLLLTFLDVESENKSTIDYTYDEIIRLTNRSKQREKEGIIKYLGDMSIQERKVEDMFKNYRLGRWNVGQQTGLIEYDKDTYDRERNELLQQLYENGGEDNPTEMMREIYDLDQERLDYNEDEDVDIYDRPAVGLDDLGENYMDGEYYEEDRDENDFGDE